MKRGESANVAVRVHPRSSRERIKWDGQTLHVWLTVPPVDGRANARLVEVVATAVGIPRSAVSIVTGMAGRSKRLRIADMTDELLTTRLAVHGDA